MIQASKGLRLSIGIYGRRNVGKSSLLNTVTRQSLAIVSDTPGTTTDPVEKAMELLPIGPVNWIDTAGLDDLGDLGNQRIEKSHQTMQRADIAILVTDGVWGSDEAKILTQLEAFKIPVILVSNKCDIKPVENTPLPEIAHLHKIPLVAFSAKDKIGAQQLVDELVKVTPDSFWAQRPIVADILPENSTVVLVIPIDKEAPRGRLILPQVQTIRDLLDGDHHVYIIKENQVKDALNNLKTPPALVVCDSQVFHLIKNDVPNDIAFTSFSVLFARFKGDLDAFIEGTRAIRTLKPGDKVLIAEACTHHPIGEDIGTIKIPRALNKIVGGELQFDHAQGHDLPANLDEYKLLIHCGACTFNAKEVMTRIRIAQAHHIPVSNYGLALAYCAGIFERAVAPFVSSNEV